MYTHLRQSKLSVTFQYNLNEGVWSSRTRIITGLQGNFPQQQCFIRPRSFPQSMLEGILRESFKRFINLHFHCVS